MRLVGKVVAVTGAARGIGAETVRAFAARGARVAAGDLQAPTDLPPGSVGLQVDVTDEASFAAFLDAAEARLGSVDVLVNNAGVQHLGPFADETDERRDRQLAVNLLGTLLGCRLAARRMAGRGGWIVNVASAAGVRGFAGGATYCATKHAVVGLSEALRNELAPMGIRVSVVIPGVVLTELAAGVRSAAGIAPVTACAAGCAIADGVRDERPQIWVPRSVGRAHRVLGLLPRRIARAVEHRTGIDRILLDVDDTARAAYEARIGAL